MTGMAEVAEKIVTMEQPPALAADTGLLSLAIIGRLHQTDVDVPGLCYQLGLGARRASGPEIVRAANLVGLKARLQTDQPPARLESAPRPAIIRMQDGGYYVLNRFPNGEDSLRDPLDMRARSVARDELLSQWSGEIILVTQRATEEEDERKFSLSWFVRAALHHRRPLLHVLISSCFVQVFALVTPLLFQVIVDKVLVHRTISTLDVVIAAMVVIGFFDVTLQYLRSYALYHTASRIDVDLGSQMFLRLFKLPLSYFETRPAGQTVARVREVENVRTFLTGQGITSIIDTLFTVLFVAFLFTYSVKLTIIVICSAPLYAIAGMVIRPILRNKIKERFNRGAISQQFLVESVVGAHTLKAAAVEPIIQQQWELRLAAYVSTSFQTVMLSNLGQVVIQYIGKLTTAMILFFGAEAVISGDLTVGQLIAFNMIANQLVTPIMRLAQLWQDVQQVQISVERLGDIFNAEPEQHALAASHLPQTRIRGDVELSNVTFRYRAGTPAALSDVSLKIPAGQVIGIVGPSGSGKSTLTKLVQRLYAPEQGAVMIDGIDLGNVHPAWFRRQIGVVLQENLLFNRTVYENIALANPGMNREVVVAVARLAGADEFIRQLPMGYETRIEERGANLSGGQRQRIAIARALATNPRLLIFDEATSALDYESERVIQKNMREIVRGRTVIIVAHRLAAVRDCHRIISMAEGKIIEDGTHEELLKHENGLYAHLWALQSAK